MSNKPFKFRRANEIAGAFTVTVIILLIGLILLSGQVRGWFQHKRYYEVLMPPSGTHGLRAGSEVKILGTRVGAVQWVKLLPKGGALPSEQPVWELDPEELELVAGLELRGDHTVLVGKESEVVLRGGLGGVLAPHLEVTRGRTPAGDGRRLKLREVSEVQKDVTDVVEEIRDAMLPAIAEIEQSSSQIGEVAQGLAQLIAEVNRGQSPAGVFLKDRDAGTAVRESMERFNATSQTLTEILAGLEGGKGPAGLLLKDAGVERQLAESFANLEKATAAANESIAMINDVAATLPQTLRSTDEAIEEYTGVAQTLEETVREYEIVGEALQRHWLIRRFVKRDENPLAVTRGQEGSVESPTSKTKSAT